MQFDATREKRQKGALSHQKILVLKVGGWAVRSFNNAKNERLSWQNANTVWAV